METRLGKNTFSISPSQASLCSSIHASSTFRARLAVAITRFYLSDTNFTASPTQFVSLFRTVLHFYNSTRACMETRLGKDTFSISPSQASLCRSIMPPLPFTHTFAVATVLFILYKLHGESHAIA